MVFLSWRLPVRNTTLDVFDSLFNFDALTYEYISICSFMVCMLLARMSLRKRPFYHKRVRGTVRVILRCFSCILRLLLGQTNYDPVLATTRMLWVAFVAAIFVTITGFFENLMHTEMVAFIHQPELHNVDDLLNGDFRHFQPILCKTFFFYNVALLKAVQRTGSMKGLLRAERADFSTWQ